MHSSDQAIDYSPPASQSDRQSSDEQVFESIVIRRKDSSEEEITENEPPVLRKASAYESV